MASLRDTLRRWLAEERDLNAVDREGNTLLHRAVLEHDPDLLQLLLEQGVKRELKNHWGCTPAELARWLDEQHCLSLLIPQGNPVIAMQVERGGPVERLSLESFEARTGVRWVRAPFFENESTIKKVAQLCHRVEKRGGMDEEMLWLGALHRADIEEGNGPDCVIRWVSEEIGHGLFADQDITSGSYVGEYAGLIKRRRFFSSFRINDYCFRYPTAHWFRPYFTINAEGCGNYTRYINHSPHPNLECAAVFSNGFFHLIFRAIQDIPKGSQLCYDYGPQYWKDRASPLGLEG